MADAEQTLRELLDKILDKKDYRPREVSIKAITSEGANFTSALFLVSVTSPKRDDLKLFAKVANVGEQMRSRMNADWLYSTERFVYSKLMKIYKDIEDKYNVPEEHKYNFPIVYGYNEELGKETVVMENLIASGYKPFNRLKSMDIDQAFAGVDNLAKFHALSFAFAKHYPKEFDELTENMKYEMMNGEVDERMKEVWKNAVEGSLELLEEDQRDAVRHILVGAEKYWTVYNVPIGRPVLVHGDYRLSNLLHKKQGDSVEVIAVDYQTVYAGTPVSDLVYFISLGTDEEFRRQHFDRLLEHYYTRLEEGLKRLDVDPSEVYSRGKFYSDLRKMLPYAVFLATTILQVVTVEAESAPKLEGHFDVEDFNLKPNELYAQRFRGIINDCSRWGVL